MDGSPWTYATVAREAELASLSSFVTAATAPLVQVITGEPGIGKTTLWESVLAESAGRVLSTRASAAEARLSFAGLTDLLSGVGDRALAALPGPQRHALEVALRRIEPEAESPEELATSLGFLSLLIAASKRAPVVVAVDDVQWLDRATADVIAFSIRRLRDMDTRVRFLFSHRTGTRAPLLVAAGADRTAQLALTPLSPGAIRRILFDRLALSLTRRSLYRLHDAAQGNPLFALELGRTILERDDDDEDGALVPPRNVEELLGLRVSRLPEPQRQLLVAVGVCSTLSTNELAALKGAAVVEEAAAAGVVIVDQERVRPAHPLLAAAALELAHPDERRAVMARLADVVTDARLALRVRAAAAVAPDETLGAVVAAAAAEAERRGDLDEAVVLSGHALRLAAPGSPHRAHRVLLNARQLAMSGDAARCVELLRRELDALPAGRVRAEALVGLASEVTEPEEVRRYLRRAVLECPDDPGIRAAVTAILALREAAIEVRDVAGSETRLAAELPHASAAGADLEAEILIDMLWINALRGYSVAECAMRFPALPAHRLPDAPLGEMIDAQHLFWRGETGEARGRLQGLLARAELGTRFYALNRLYLCDLALRCGEWEEAERLLDEWAESADDTFVWPMYERCRAQLAAGRGLVEETERWAVAAIARADATGEGWNRLEAIRARGIGALAAGNAQVAVAHLRTVWEHTEREGVDDPGVFPVAPDLVEALCETGEIDGARSVATRLAAQAEALAHPWARLGVRRCEGLLRGTEEGRVDELVAVASEYAARGLAFDRARSLLAGGRLERRRRRWAAARDLLEQAVEAFERLDSPGWVEQSRSELSRVGARRRTPEGGLTPSEARTAALAAEGLTNKEIAARLHVTVHTVEVHLSRTYAKLGVRSRAQLAARVREASG
ncbi:MAG: AAA family ATPase [Gaiellales bacterium]